MNTVNLRIVWLILGFIVFSIQANAQDKVFDESVLSEKGKQAYQALLKVNTFALFGVGYGGATSEGELALDALTEEKEAILAFRSLVTNATAEGGIYALIGLKMLECGCFHEELLNYKKLPEPKRAYLQTQRGCVGSQQKRSKVIQEVQSGKMVEVKIHNYKISKQGEQKSN